MSLTKMIYCLTLFLAWIGSVALFFIGLVFLFANVWEVLPSLGLIVAAIYIFAIITWALNREFGRKK